MSAQKVLISASTSPNPLRSEKNPGIKVLEESKLLARKYPPIDAGYATLSERIDWWVPPHRTGKVQDFSAARVSLGSA